MSDRSVLRQSVLDVLARHGVEISTDPDGVQSLLVKDGKPPLVLVVTIPDSVENRLPQRLQREFGIPIHHFYNPLMAPTLPDESGRIH